MGFFLIMTMRRSSLQNRERQAMLANLDKNDKVLTIGGIYGTVVMVNPNEDEVTIKVDDNTRLKITKASVRATSPRNRPRPRPRRMPPRRPPLSPPSPMVKVRRAATVRERSLPLPHGRGSTSISLTSVNIDHEIVYLEDPDLSGPAAARDPGRRQRASTSTDRAMAASISAWTWSAAPSSFMRWTNRAGPMGRCPPTTTSTN